MLEMRATDTLNQQTDSVILPVSGKTVTIEAETDDQPRESHD
jgi:hypothetical protein